MSRHRGIYLLLSGLVFTGAAEGQIPSPPPERSPAGERHEPAKTTIPGHQLPSYFAVSMFLGEVDSIWQMSAEWAHPTPAPWQVHVLDPLGVEAGSDLEAALIHGSRKAVALVESFSPGEIDTSSREAFERTQLQALDRRARELGAIFVGLLKEFERAGVAKSRLVQRITQVNRAEFSASSSTDKPSATLRSEMQARYAGFDEVVRGAFPHLDPTEVLP